MFSCRILNQKIFSAMLHQNIICWNKFFNSSSNFSHSFMVIWSFQKQSHSRLYLQSCKLVIVNSQIKIFPIMLSSCFIFITKGRLYFSLIYSFYCCLVKGVKPTLLGGHNIEGRTDILVNWQFLIVKSGHFPFALMQGLFVLTISKVFYNQLSW